MEEVSYDNDDKTWVVSGADNFMESDQNLVSVIKAYIAKASFKDNYVDLTTMHDFYSSQNPHCIQHMVSLVT